MIYTKKHISKLLHRLKAKRKQEKNLRSKFQKKSTAKKPPEKFHIWMEKFEDFHKKMMIKWENIMKDSIITPNTIQTEISNTVFKINHNGNHVKIFQIPGKTLPYLLLKQYQLLHGKKSLLNDDQIESKSEIDLMVREKALNNYNYLCENFKRFIKMQPNWVDKDQLTFAMCDQWDMNTKLHNPSVTANDIIVRWVHFAKVDDIKFINEETVIMSRGCHFLILNVSTANRRIYKLNDPCDGEKISCFCTDPNKQIFAFSGWKSYSILIVDYSNLSKIAILDDSIKEDYLCMAMGGGDLIYALRRYPTFRLSIWNYKTMELVHTMCKAIVSNDAFLLAHPAEQYCYMVSTTETSVVSKFCVQSFSRLCTVDEIEIDLHPKVKLCQGCFSPNNNVYFVDNWGCVYGVSEKHKLVMIFKWRIKIRETAIMGYPCVPVAKAGVQWYKKGVLIQGPSGYLRYLTKIMDNDHENKQCCVWEIQREVTETHLASSRSGNSAVIHCDKMGLHVIEEGRMVTVENYCYLKVENVAFLYSKCKYFVASSGSNLQVWSTSNGHLLHKFYVKIKVGSMISHPHYPYIVITSSETGSFRAIDLRFVRKPNQIFDMWVSKESIPLIRFSPDGEKMVVLTPENRILLFRADPRMFSFEEMYELEGPVLSLLVFIAPKICDHCLITLQTHTDESNRSHFAFYTFPLSCEGGFSSSDEYFELEHCYNPEYAFFALTKDRSSIHKLLIDITGVYLECTKLAVINLPQLISTKPNILSMQYHFVSWGKDGLIRFWNDPNLQPFSIIMNHHRYDGGTKQVIVDKRCRHFLTLGEDGVLGSYTFPKKICGHEVHSKLPDENYIPVPYRRRKSLIPEYEAMLMPYDVWITQIKTYKDIRKAKIEYAKLVQDLINLKSVFNALVYVNDIQEDNDAKLTLNELCITKCIVAQVFGEILEKNKNDIVKAYDEMVECLMESFRKMKIFFWDPMDIHSFAVQGINQNFNCSSYAIRHMPDNFFKERCYGVRQRIIDVQAVDEVTFVPWNKNLKELDDGQPSLTSITEPGTVIPEQSLTEVLEGEESESESDDDSSSAADLQQKDMDKTEMDFEFEEEFDIEDEEEKEEEESDGEEQDNKMDSFDRDDYYDVSYLKDRLYSGADDKDDIDYFKDDDADEEVFKPEKKIDYPSEYGEYGEEEMLEEEYLDLEEEEFIEKEEEEEEEALGEEELEVEEEDFDIYAFNSELFGSAEYQSFSKINLYEEELQEDVLEEDYEFSESQDEAAVEDVVPSELLDFSLPLLSTQFSEEVLREETLEKQPQKEMTPEIHKKELGNFKIDPWQSPKARARALRKLLKLKRANKRKIVSKLSLVKFQALSDSFRKLKSADLSDVVRRTVKIINLIQKHPPRHQITLDNLNDYVEKKIITIENTFNHYLEIPIRESPNMLEANLILSADTLMPFFKDNIFKLKRDYNNQMIAMRTAKLREIELTAASNKQIHELIGVLRDSCRLPDHLLPSEPTDIIIEDCEVPEAMISVKETEIPALKILNEREQALIQEAIEREKEELRLYLLDAWKAEALMEMMDGVLVVTWKDMLKQDIPVPDFVLNKKVDEFTLEEIDEAREYLAKIDERRNLCFQYVKEVKEEIKSILMTTQKSYIEHNRQLRAILEMKFQLITAVGSERLKITRLKERKSAQCKILEFIQKLRGWLYSQNMLMKRLREILYVMKKEVLILNKKYISCRKNDKKLKAKFVQNFDVNTMKALNLDKIMTLYQCRPPCTITDECSATDLRELANTGLDFDKAKYPSAEHDLYFAHIVLMNSNNFRPTGIDKNIWDTIVAHRKDKIICELRTESYKKDLAKGKEVYKNYEDILNQVYKDFLIVKNTLLKAQNLLRDLYKSSELQLVLPNAHLETEDSTIELSYTALLVDVSFLDNLNFILKNVLDGRCTAGDRLMAILKETGMKEFNHIMLRCKADLMQKETNLIEQFPYSGFVQKYLHILKTNGTFPDIDSVEIQNVQKEEERKQAEMERIEQLKIEAQEIRDVDIKAERMSLLKERIESKSSLNKVSLSEMFQPLTPFTSLIDPVLDLDVTINDINIPYVEIDLKSPTPEEERARRALYGKRDYDRFESEETPTSSRYKKSASRATVYQALDGDIDENQMEDSCLDFELESAKESSSKPSSITSASSHDGLIDLPDESDEEISHDSQEIIEQSEQNTIVEEENIEEEEIHKKSKVESDYSDDTDDESHKGRSVESLIECRGSAELVRLPDRFKSPDDKLALYDDDDNYFNDGTNNEIYLVPKIALNLLGFQNDYFYLRDIGSILRNYIKQKYPHTFRKSFDQEKLKDEIELPAYLANLEEDLLDPERDIDINDRDAIDEIIEEIENDIADEESNEDSAVSSYFPFPYASNETIVSKSESSSEKSIHGDSFSQFDDSVSQYSDNEQIQSSSESSSIMTKESVSVRLSKISDDDSFIRALVKQDNKIKGPQPKIKEEEEEDYHETVQLVSYMPPDDFKRKKEKKKWSKANFNYLYTWRRTKISLHDKKYVFKKLQDIAAMLQDSKNYNPNLPYYSQFENLELEGPTVPRIKHDGLFLLSHLDMFHSLYFDTSSEEEETKNEPFNPEYDYFIDKLNIKTVVPDTESDSDDTCKSPNILGIYDVITGEGPDDDLFKIPSISNSSTSIDEPKPKRLMSIPDEEQDEDKSKDPKIEESIKETEKNKESLISVDAFKDPDGMIKVEDLKELFIDFDSFDTESSSENDLTELLHNEEEIQNVDNSEEKDIFKKETEKEDESLESDSSESTTDPTIKFLLDELHKKQKRELEAKIAVEKDKIIIHPEDLDEFHQLYGAISEEMMRSLKSIEQKFESAEDMFFHLAETDSYLASLVDVKPSQEETPIPIPSYIMHYYNDAQNKIIEALKKCQTGLNQSLQERNRVFDQKREAITGMVAELNELEHLHTVNLSLKDKEARFTHLKKIRELLNFAESNKRDVQELETELEALHLKNYPTFASKKDLVR